MGAKCQFYRALSFLAEHHALEALRRIEAQAEQMQVDAVARAMIREALGDAWCDSDDMDAGPQRTQTEG